MSCGPTGTSVPQDGDRLLTRAELKGLVGQFGIHPTESELADLVEELSGTTGSTSVRAERGLQRGCGG